ncbi:S66 peptidase family protein [Clostridium sp.]|uniref:S66 peptidase family protein n=1 Tax=Clostridium sp. TaxID=1506 RepID=UPI003F30A9DA
MVKLKKLNSNSTIGIICPSSPEDSAFIDEKISKFKELGFNIKEGSYIYDTYGYLAGTDTDRAKDLMDMFSNPEIDAIVCFRGGYGCVRMAPYLDLNIIKKNPKPFCGYSDITLLLNYINKKCNFPTFHSPMINSKFDDELTLKYFMNVLTNFNKNSFYNLKKLSNNNIQYINKRDFTGKLVGGNLSLIASTLGTPYEVDFNNSILLIEEISENPYAIDRMLSQLILSGSLKKCSAIILGHFTDCSCKNKNTFSLIEVLYQKLSHLDIPIIIGLPFGHDYPNITLPIGAKFSFTAQNDLLTLKENIFK